MRGLLAALTLTTLFAALAAAQQPAATPTATSCAQAQAVIDGLLASATARVEAARLTNSAADMRAAVDGLQSVIRDVRTQLAPCATLQPADPAAADPHAGHEQPASATTATLDIAAWLTSFDAAFIAKDLGKLAAFYHPDVTISEGTGFNNGWANYRDTHLGPELKSFSGLEFGHTNATVRMLGDHVAYATSEFFLRTRMNGKPLDVIGRETLILEHADGAWQIRHAHMSTRSRVK
jgi:ketosteroid isomerase-like protein